MRASLAEAHASRTHHRPLRTISGFEDREDHRILRASLIGKIDWPLKACLKQTRCLLDPTTAFPRDRSSTPRVCEACHGHHLYQEMREMREFTALHCTRQQLFP